MSQHVLCVFRSKQHRSMDQWFILSPYSPVCCCYSALKPLARGLCLRLWKVRIKFTTCVSFLPFCNVQLYNTADKPAYFASRKFDSIYIGWGLKSPESKYGFSPTVVPAPQSEYTSGPEITEALDPTLDEEQALKAALEEQRAAQEEAEGLDDEEEDD